MTWPEARRQGFCVDADDTCTCIRIRASTQENLSSGLCEQHRRRPACASAQSDQRLCYSPFGKYYMLTCYRCNFNFLTSLSSWGDCFETRFVGNPEDRFSRDDAHTDPCCCLPINTTWNKFSS